MMASNGFVGCSKHLTVEDQIDIGDNNNYLQHLGGPSKCECKCSHCAKCEFGSSESDSPFMNPLLLPDILHNVLNHVPVSSLETHRLVCKQWNEEVCRLSKLKVPVKLVFTRTKNHLPQPSLQDFTNYMLHMMNTNDFPHAHFEFRKIMPLHRALFHTSNDMMQCFLNKFGPSIKYLHVDILNSAFQFVDLLQSIQTKLLSLETLSLAFYNFGQEQVPISASGEEFYFPQIKHFNIETNRSREEEYLAKLIPNLFAKMPNIVWVSSSCNSLNPYAENPQVMTGVLRSISDGLAPNLVRVDVLLKLDNSEMQTLVEETHFQPKTLSISFEENASAIYFKALLKKFAGTLETLLIKSPYNNICYSDKFPGENTILGKIRELTLSSFFCGSLQSLSKVPALSKLKLSNVPADLVFIEAIIGNRDHPLKALDITGCSSQEIRTLRIVASAFKNLRSLSFDPTDATMQIIYEHLPQLEELYVSGELDELTDFGICGIPTERCEQLIQRFSLDELPEDQDPLNIGKLQKLTTLKLEFGKMTDASVLYGIIFSKRIQHLTIGSSSITGNSVRAAVDNLEFLQFFDITSCKHLSFDSLLYAHQKIDGKCGKFIVNDGRSAGDLLNQ